MSFALSGTIPRESGRLGSAEHCAHLLMAEPLFNSVRTQFRFLLTVGLVSLSGYDLYAIVLGFGIFTILWTFACVTPGDPRATSSKRSHNQWLTRFVSGLMSAMLLSPSYPGRSAAIATPSPKASLYWSALVRWLSEPLWAALGQPAINHHSC